MELQTCGIASLVILSRATNSIRCPASSTNSHPSCLDMTSGASIMFAHGLVLVTSYPCQWNILAYQTAVVSVPRMCLCHRGKTAALIMQNMQPLVNVEWWAGKGHGKSSCFSSSLRHFCAIQYSLLFFCEIVLQRLCDAIPRQLKTSLKEKCTDGMIAAASSVCSLARKSLLEGMVASATTPEKGGCFSRRDPHS